MKVERATKKYTKLELDPSANLVPKCRRIDVNAKKSRRIDVNTMLFLRHVPAGICSKNKVPELIWVL